MKGEMEETTSVFYVASYLYNVNDFGPHRLSPVLKFEFVRTIFPYYDVA